MQFRRVQQLAVSGALLALAILAGRTESLAGANDAREAVRKAAKEMYSQPHVREVIRTTNGSGRKIEMDVEIIPPTQWHVKSGRLEMIVLRDAAYMLKQGQWIRVPNMTGSRMAQSMPQLVDADSATMTYSVIGPGVGQGARCTIYRAVKTAKGRTTEGKFWIRNADGLMVHGESTSETPTKIEYGVMSGGKRTVIVDVDYVTPVTIHAPNVK